MNCPICALTADMMDDGDNGSYAVVTDTSDNVVDYGLTAFECESNHTFFVNTLQEDDNDFAR